MHCLDFEFDHKRLSDHGFIICGFEGAEQTWSGGDVSFTTMKPPSSDRYTHYTSTYETPLTATFQICKNVCEADDPEDFYLTQDDCSNITKWLQRMDGYHWVAFDQEGFEDVWYHAQFNLQPHFIRGRLAGYDVTMNTDSPYGYSQIWKKTATLASGDSLKIKNYSDMPGIIYPRITIRNIQKQAQDQEQNQKQGQNQDPNIIIRSGCNLQKTTRLYVAEGDIVVLDKEQDFISNVNLNSFNFVFPIMENTCENITTCFKNDGVDCELTIEYRFIRRVMV